MHIEGNFGFRDPVNIFYRRGAFDPEMHRVSPACQLLPFDQEIPSVSIRIGFRTVHIWLFNVAYCSEAVIDVSV